MPGSPSTNADAYLWIGPTSASWLDTLNWADTTSGANPASFIPGSTTPVTITNAETITGGGTAAGVMILGTVSLSGGYSIGGALVIGRQVVTNSFGVSQTIGSLSLLASTTLTAAAVSIVDGGLALASGASLVATGAITAGSLAGIYLPFNNGYVRSNGAPAIIGLAAGASLSAAGLALNAGTLADAGGTIAIANTFSVGVAATSDSVLPELFASNGTVNVTAGGTVAVGGDVKGGQFTVSGAGSTLRVMGDFGSPAGVISNVAARSGGFVQLGSASSFSFLVDATSTIEIGTIGGASAGALTVDAGNTVVATGSSGVSGSLIDNGIITIASGTLTQTGSLAGSGTLQIGAGATLDLYGDAAASDTIDFHGAGATLLLRARYTVGYPITGPFYSNVASGITGFAPGDVVILGEPITGIVVSQGNGGMSVVSLSDRTGVIETLSFVGDFSGRSFFLSSTSSGASLNVIDDATATGEPVATDSDAYAWVGPRGGAWGSAGNWQDMTSGQSPAGFVPGSGNAVTITGPAGTVAIGARPGAFGAYDVIFGGGAAASLDIAGDVDLVGTYNVVGRFTVGVPATTTSDGSASTTTTPGALVLSDDDVVSTTSVAAAGGVIALAVAATLTASGAVSVGVLPSSSPSGGITTNVVASVGTISLMARSSLSSGGDLAVGDGNLVDDGGLVSVAGTLTVGSVVAPNPSFLNTAGFVSISNGGAVVVGGDAIVAQGSISVDGAGSALRAAGMITASGTVSATNGASVTSAGVVLAGGGLSLGVAGLIEIGRSGGASSGFVTVDAGATIESRGYDLIAGPLIDDGTILVNGSGLTTNDITGSGVLKIGAHGTLDSYGTIDAGIQLSFAGPNAAISFGPIGVPSGDHIVFELEPIHAVLNGFSVSDSILLPFSTVDSAMFTQGQAGNPGTLVITAGTTTLETLQLAGDFTGKSFVLGPVANSYFKSVTLTDATTACFTTGTRIATPTGLVPVEQLAIGDLVLTASGAARPIAWIGRRAVDVANHPQPYLLQPVRFNAGAIAPGIPCVDLRLSPDHAVLLDSVLIAAHRLVNGRSIVIETVAKIIYWHVELDSHDILLAEGMAVESYLDTGNRSSFAGDVVRLHADFSTDPRCYASHGAAPLIDDPERVRPIWQRLEAQARRRDSIDGPELVLVVNAERIAPRVDGSGRHWFVLPAGAARAVLVSRSARPSDRMPWGGDRRRLGVAVGRILCDGMPFELDGLRDGWHPMERSGIQRMRWTDGAAVLEVPAGTHCVEILVTMTQPDAGEMETAV